MDQTLSWDDLKAGQVIRMEINRLSVDDRPIEYFYTFVREIKNGVLTLNDLVSTQESYTEYEWTVNLFELKEGTIHADFKLLEIIDLSKKIDELYPEELI